MTLIAVPAFDFVSIEAELPILKGGTRKCPKTPKAYNHLVGGFSHRPSSWSRQIVCYHSH